MGGLSLLFAVVLIVVRTETTVLSEALASNVWAEDAGFSATIAVLVALAAMTKSAQFPFHMWLPDAMVAPTPVSAYLHAAAMVKAGIYLLMLFSPALGGNLVWASLLLGAGLTTAVMGAIFALRCFDLKEIMAYSTVSQLGLIVALIGLGTPAALATAALYTLAHALFKASLFMVVGVVDRQAGTRDIRLLSGLWRRMPVTFVTTVLAGLSMAGVFPLLGFISKEYLLARCSPRARRGGSGSRSPQSSFLPPRPPSPTPAASSLAPSPTTAARTETTTLMGKKRTRTFAKQSHCLCSHRSFPRSSDWGLPRRLLCCIRSPERRKCRFR